MSALERKKSQPLSSVEDRLAKDINLVYDFTEKPNRTQLKAKSDRAVVANLRADLVLPNDKILTVDIDFDTVSGYHNNTMMIMDDFGVEMLTAGFSVKYGQQFADSITKAWQEKQKNSDPRKPTYLLIQKPINEGALPKVFATCGGKHHDDGKKLIPETVV
jgi:hypothetical protein